MTVPTSYQSSVPSRLNIFPKKFAGEFFDCKFLDHRESKIAVHVRYIEGSLANDNRSGNSPNGADFWGFN
jgi:hypothetical protein